MLILTRRIGESICIGDDVKITVSNAVGIRVRIGIDAPPETKVLREELFKGDVNDSITDQAIVLAQQAVAWWQNNAQDEEPPGFIKFAYDILSVSEID